jgi:hypothetical protein
MDKLYRLVVFLLGQVGLAILAILDLLDGLDTLALLDIQAHVVYRVCKVISHKITTANFSEYLVKTRFNTIFVFRHAVYSAWCSENTPTTTPT